MSIVFGFRVRVDAAYNEVFYGALERFREMGRRVGRGEMHRKAPAS